MSLISGLRVPRSTNEPFAIVVVGTALLLPATTRKMLCSANGISVRLSVRGQDISLWWTVFNEILLVGICIIFRRRRHQVARSETIADSRRNDLLPVARLNGVRSCSIV